MHPPILTDKEKDEAHRTKMVECWRATLKLEEDLGMDPSQTVLEALEEIPSEAPQAPVRPDPTVVSTGVRRARRSKHRANGGIPVNRGNKNVGMMHVPTCNHCGLALEPSWKDAGTGLCRKCILMPVAMDVTPSRGACEFCGKPGLAVLMQGRCSECMVKELDRYNYLTQEEYARQRQAIDGHFREPIVTCRVAGNGEIIRPQAADNAVPDSVLNLMKHGLAGPQAPEIPVEARRR